ncbi:MAG TPA: hypothetical protein VEW45_05820 [Candidatus Dormibacteraeota bacterium]|nr:hypothetical protein [Candidatus Dormibacteraeota bacterium]
MPRPRRGIALVLILAGMLLAGCGQPTVEAATEEAIKIEPIDGTELARITLSERAAVRLGIETEPVRDETRAGEPRAGVSFAAVVYDAQGNTWAYTTTEPLVFVRHAITVDFVDGGNAVLTDGPGAGTEVVTVGAAELYGAETGVGGGH